MSSLSRVVITAHPDDETLGFGGTIATYAADGVAVRLITATRGDRGRWHGVSLGQQGQPGVEAVATAREAELRRDAAVLGFKTSRCWTTATGCSTARIRTTSAATCRLSLVSVARYTCPIRLPRSPR